MEIRKRDLFAPANFISLAGALLVARGLHHGMDTRKGIALVGIGRVFDMIDGFVARKTKTSSELGALVDATLDKGGMAAIIAHQVKLGIMPEHVAAGMILQHGINTVANGTAHKKYPGMDLSPTIEGKRGMFAQNIAVGMFAVAAVMREDHPRIADMAYHVAEGAANTGTYVYGGQASLDYIQRTR